MHSSVKAALFLILVVFTSSCATVLNKRYGKTEITTSETVNYVYQGDTLLNKINTPFTVYKKREKAPLEVQLFNDSTSRKLIIGSKKSWVYWANSTSYFFLGFLVDEISKRKFTYPKKVYVDLSQTEISYLPYVPMTPDLILKKNRISVTPTSWIGRYHPGIELSFQRLHGSKFATQVSYSHLISRQTPYARDTKGFKLGIEEKFFIQNTNDYRIYTSLTFEYLRKNHQDSFNFLIPDDTPDNPFDNDRFTQSVEIEKRFLSITPRIGFEKYLSKRLVFDSYFGLGFRYRRVRLPGISTDSLFEDESDSIWGDYRYSSNKPNNNLTVSFDLNFRLGWTF